MMIIGVDYHPSFQVIAFLIEETGEYAERELNHSDGEAERFYRDLHQRGMRVRVGMEATGFSRWFERLLAELEFELWIGDPAEIKAKRVKKQKYDREDARLLLRLLRENNFPKIWVPSPENRDLRQLLWHRHRLVQMRTRIMNQLQALAMNEGQRWKKKLWSAQGRAELQKLSLAPWASRRRKELLELLDRLDPSIDELTATVGREARKRPDVLRLMTHPGVGPLTALAYVFPWRRRRLASARGGNREENLESHGCTRGRLSLDGNPRGPCALREAARRDPGIRGVCAAGDLCRAHA